MATEEIKISFYGHRVLLKRKSYQKRLSVSVHPSGLIRVSGNKSLKQKEILKFLEQQKNWIFSSVEEAEKLKRKYPPKLFMDGEAYPYLGKDYCLKIIYERELGLKFSENNINFSIPARRDTFCDENRKKYLKLFIKSYRQVAEVLMAKRVMFQSKRMGLQPKSVHFRDQKSIWGSCSADNKISLNFKLIVAPIEVVDYVIIHELAHIQHKNHSKHFWSLVEKVTEHRQFAKKWLKNNQYKTDFLAKRQDLHP